ncbi:MAG: hypothetical protein HY731_03815 [Candidatus Tectomicrobia bacterium]|nr:hypothetical protein [Candidatus Tectomicrobia bacterium]
MDTKQAKGLLAVWTDITPGLEDEFNQWYDTEHVPERLSIPGFLTGRRYLSVEGKPKYFALYETKEASVLSSEVYLKVYQAPTSWTKKITANFQNMVRNLYEEILSLGTSPLTASPYVLTVRLGIDPEHEKEFNDWYNTDHLPALVKVPEVFAARRYKAIQGAPSYLAVYDLESVEVLKTDAWAKARDSEWTLRIRSHFRDASANVGKFIFGQ